MSCILCFNITSKFCHYSSVTKCLCRRREKRKAREGNFVIEITHMKELLPQFPVGLLQADEPPNVPTHMACILGDVYGKVRPMCITSCGLAKNEGKEGCIALPRCAPCVHTLEQSQSRRMLAKLWNGAEQRRKGVLVRRCSIPDISVPLPATTAVCAPHVSRNVPHLPLFAHVYLHCH